MASMMSESSPQERSPRVIFFGMPGDFSLPSLLTLLESGVDVCAVVVPVSPLPGKNPPAIQRREQSRPARALPLINKVLHPSIVDIAWQRQLPVWEVHSLTHASTIATLAAYEPDSICVACFSLLFPHAILHLPRLGCLNVHPSLLPANRGPAPLFWTFREGRATTGVTVHLMDERMDSGDILAQVPIEVTDGMRYHELEVLCARHGGTLLARTVWECYEDRATPIPQDEAKSSYHSFPTNEDLIVHANVWDARHVYNFIRGISLHDGPIELRVANNRFLVRDAIAYSLDADLDVLFHQSGHELIVQCRVGSVRVVLSEVC